MNIEEITCAECGETYPVEHDEERATHHDESCTMHDVLKEREVSD